MSHIDRRPTLYAGLLCNSARVVRESADAAASSRTAKRSAGSRATRYSAKATGTPTPARRAAAGTMATPARASTTTASPIASRPMDVSIARSLTSARADSVVMDPTALLFAFAGMAGLPKRPQPGGGGPPTPQVSSRAPGPGPRPSRRRGRGREGPRNLRVSLARPCSVHVPEPPQETGPEVLLSDEVSGAAEADLGGQVQRLVGRHEHDDRFRMCGVELPRRLDAVHAAHANG